MSGGEVERLVRRLLELWSWSESSSYYLEELAPAIVRDDPSLRLMDAERSTIEELRHAASPDQWSRLPDLLATAMERIRQERAEREAAARARPRLERERREREAEERRAAAEAARRAEVQRRATEEAAVRERQLRAEGLREGLLQALESDYLGVDDWHRQHPDADLVAPEDVATLKAQFVGDWVYGHLGYRLDDEQARAVATTGADVLVTARAGSGKTRALVSRAIFLMKHCHVAPAELLLVAFNRKAVEEMRDRIDTATGGQVPHIRTFHSLAYGLVRPDEDLVYDDPNAGSYARSRVLQDVIDDHLQDGDFSRLIRDVMLEHFRSDWEAIAAGGFGLSMSEFLARRRALQRETLAGDYVKSYGEKLIANTLFEYGISYRYESNFKWNGRNYHPDFVIRTGQRTGVVIEYFGMRGDSDYDEMTDDKRAFWSSHDGWTLVEVTPNDVAGDAGDFAKRLIDRLTALGIKTELRSEEEIWQSVRERAIDSFTSTVATFVSRCRKRGLSTEELHNLLATHVPVVPTEQQFLQIAQSVYDRYLTRLAETESEDFDGLMWQAVAALRDGTTRFESTKSSESGDLRRIRYVLIDEFQDFSQMFFELVEGIRRVSPAVEFFCVGDDWQAINGFAGSELQFFENFGDYFPRHRQVAITRNYRSPVRVVDVGNAVMARHGHPARAVRSDEGTVVTCDLETFETSPAEEERHEGDVFSPAILRLIRRCLERGEDVVLISRRNSVPWFVNNRRDRHEGINRLESLLEHLQRHLSVADHRRVTVSTAHRYKGLESDAVIVVDAVDRSYPLIHPSWVFLRVFGDSASSIEAEERRLFYVAVTRAKKTLLLMTEGSRVSPFLYEVQRHRSIDAVNWTTLKPAAALDGGTVEIRVHNAYDVKDMLKREGFRFNAGGKFWARSFPSDTDLPSVLRSSAWFRSPVRVELIGDGDLIAEHRAR